MSKPVSAISNLARRCALSSLAITAFLVWPAFTPASQSTQAQQNNDVQTLVSGASVERELAGGQSQVWQINLAAGDHLRLTVARKQVKLAAQLFAPASDGSEQQKPLLSTIDRNVIFEHDLQSKRMATFSLVAEVSGKYRLELSLPDKDHAPVLYEVKVEALRPATHEDKLRVAAERTELEGDLAGDGDPTLEGLLKRLAKYDASLALRRELADHKSQLRLLRTLGALHQSLGELQKSLEYYNQAIQIARDAGDRYQEANLTLAFGHIQRSQGYMQNALDAYSRARQTFVSLSARLGEAIAIENTGGIYLALGEPRIALDHYQQALPTYVSVGEPFGQSNVLNSMGLAYRNLGEPGKSIEFHARALENARQYGIAALEAAALGNLGSAHRALGDRQKAAEFYNQEFALCQRMGNRRCMAGALNAIGNLAFLTGENEKALDALSQSLELFRLTGERKNEADALYSLARTNVAAGRLQQARGQIEAALEIRESLRANLARQDLRASFFGSVQSGFDLYIDLLMSLHQQQPAAGLDAAALQASERSRARGLLEQLVESNADIRQGGDLQLLERERTLQQQLNAKAAARGAAFNRKSGEALAAALDKEIAALTSAYREVEARIRASSPRYAALTQPQPLSAAEIQQMLDENTVLLEFALGERQSWLWAVTRDSLASYQLPPRAEITAAARSHHELLIARQPKQGLTETGQWKQTAEADAKLPAESAALSRMLLGPIAARLRQEWSGKRLAIVASGALEYLPFAALPLPQQEPNPQSPQPLIANHEIVSLPSASALAVIRRETGSRTPAAKELAVLADPVFEASDPRLAIARKKAAANGANDLIAYVRSAESPSPSPGLPAALTRSARAFSRDGFGRLVFSREEADAIAGLAPRNSMLKATGFAATRRLAASGELGQYRIVHFATHGLINSEHPELSGLVLSLVDESGKPQDGFLRMHELFNLHLPADLVVLSACQTALGKEIKGEGLVGLTRGFMYAGAQRVVASLWQVDDQATAQLMRAFYRGMLKENLRPAAALRAAQAEMSRQKRWASPYYWAGFVMQGEWK